MRILVSVILMVALLSSACGEPRQDRILRILHTKLELERDRLEEKCRSEIITQASADVDSVIIQKALMDTTNIYVRPVKPDVPNLEIPNIDTLGIKPLFTPAKDSLTQIIE